MSKIAPVRYSTLAPIIAALAISGGLSMAQEAAAPKSTDEQELDKEVALLRKDLRSEKKQIIAANMKLTDKEAEKFWPVYDQYTAEVMKLNDTKYALIKQFAENMDSLSDQLADKLTQQQLTLDQSMAQLRLKYRPLFRNVLSAKNTARFFQIDRRVMNLNDLQFARAIPLVEP